MAPSLEPAPQYFAVIWGLPPDFPAFWEELARRFVKQFRQQGSRVRARWVDMCGRQISGTLREVRLQ